MAFPIQIDIINMGLPIFVFKRPQVEFSKLLCISIPEASFDHNSADPDKMQHAAFHLGLCCLSEYQFRVLQCKII